MLPIKIDLPEGFLDEEERCGYLVSSKMKKLWAVELDLLAEFIRVCKKYDLKYYADAGTILGAVRHKGFIPWDDDIDVMMMRDEYDKLCSVAEKEFAFPYFFQTKYTDKGYFRGHAQLRNSRTTCILNSEYGKHLNYNRGIFLDIFPLDSVPNNNRLLRKSAKKLHRYRNNIGRILRYTEQEVKLKKNSRSKVKEWICGVYVKFFKILLDCDKEYAKFEKECVRYNTKNTKRVCKYFQTPLNIKRRVWPKSNFDSSIYLRFEMLDIPVPSGYENILNRFYGDWKEFIVGTSTHGSFIFDAEIPYTEYEHCSVKN